MFRFALEPLLQRRRTVEDTLRARYAASAREEARAIRVREELDAAFWEACAGRTRGRDLSEIERAFRVQTARIERGRVLSDRLHAALIEAGRARRALELLRERQLSAYARERRRRDERELDETNRAGRARAAQGY